MRKRPYLKVLHIISGDLWAGAEAMAFQLLNGLQKDQNIELTVIILNQGRLLELCCSRGIRTYLIDESYFSLPAIIRKAALTCRRVRPDLIHSHRYKENIIAASVQMFCGMPKLVATQHGRMEVQHLSPLQRVKNAITYLTLNQRFAAVAAVSNDTRDYLMNECKIDADKILTISNGIDIGKVHQSAKKNRENAVIVGSAGRLFQVKNFPCMINIAHEVLKHRPNVKFLLAGDGPEKEFLSHKIQQYGLADRFKMLGHLNDMDDFYEEIDIYINTSRHEGTPMTILEAMSRGIPVLAFNHAGIKEIIKNGVDGYLIPTDDIHNFAKRIIKLSEDCETLQKIGKNAMIKIADFYSMLKMVDEYRSLYTTVNK